MMDTRHLQGMESCIRVLNEMSAAGGDPGAVGLEVGL